MKTNKGVIALAVLIASAILSVGSFGVYLIGHETPSDILEINESERVIDVSEVIFEDEGVGQASGSGSSLWRIASNKIRTISATWGLQVPSLGSPGTPCLTVSVDGTFGTSTPNCNPWTTNGDDIYYNDGNVGIGTTSPYAKLSVVGEIVGEYFTATSTTATTTLGGGLDVNNGLLLVDHNTGNVGVDTFPTTIGKLKVGGAGYFLREPNAFDTSSPYTTLILDGSSNGALFAFGRANSANEPFVGLSGWDSGSDRILYFGGGQWSTPDATRLEFFTTPTYTEDNNTGRMRMVITPDGSIGIGNDTTPDALIEVTADGGISDFLMLSNDDNGDGNRFIVKNSGNVGINDTTPTYKLTVNGDAQFSSYVDAEYFTATSTTAISTFANHISIADTKSYRIKGVPVLFGSDSAEPFNVGHSNTVAGTGIAVGYGNTSTNVIASIAVGASNSSAGYQSTAIGHSNSTSAAASLSAALGTANQITAGLASAIGYSNIASAVNAQAIGYVNTATNISAVGIGNQNNATAIQSVAMGFNNDVTALGAVALGANLTNAVTGSLMLGVSNNAKLTVLSNGNFGVGTTSPFARLTVWANGTDTLIEAVDSASTTQFSLLNDGTAFFNGNVGIGTSTPYAKLTVWADGTGTGTLFEAVDNASTTRLKLLDNGELTVSGDMIFSGSGTGVPYGEISGDENTTPTTISVQGTWYQVIDFNTNGISNLSTPDHTNDHITIDKTGAYKVEVSYSLNGVGSGGDSFAVNVFKNNGATEMLVHSSLRIAGGTSDENTGSVSGLTNLTSGDTVELWIKNKTGTTNIIVEDMTMSLFMVGG